MKLLNLILFLILPLFSCEAKEWLLEGVQTEKRLTIDISQDKLTFGKEYTIPKGKMLHIQGAGQLYTSVTNREDGVASLNVQGMLFFGYPKYSLKNKDELSTVHHPWHKTGYLKLMMNDPKAIIQSKGVRFNNFRFYLYQGNTKFEYSEFSGKLNLPFFNKTYKGKAIFNYCHFTDGEMSINLDPKVTTKLFQFNRCITSNVAHLPLFTLFSMNQCDILNRPFPMGNQDFKQVTRMPKKIYFKDKEYYKLLNELHGKKIKGFRLKPSRKRFAEKLNFEIVSKK